MRQNPIMLDPNHVEDSMRQLARAYELPDATLAALRRVVAHYPHPVRMYVDEANAILYENLTLADKFSFDIQTDDLILFTREPDVFVDAFVEMAMYLAGFATMMGNRDEWIIEFTIGAWKPVRNRIKRKLGLPVKNQPRIVVGLPPRQDRAPRDNPYPFRTLVSTYDFASFHQMVVLAARDDVAVYFPPETHSKVLAVYVYMRRAIQEVAEGLDLEDHATFNERLIDTIRRLENLFSPSQLAPPGWKGPGETDEDDTPGLEFLSGPEATPKDQASDNPFEDFIEELFADDDPDDNDG